MREKLRTTANNTSLQGPMKSTTEGNCFRLVSAGVGHSSRKLYGNFCRHNNRGQHGLQTVPADLVLKHADNPVSVSMWRPEESSRWAATPSSSIRPTSMAHLPPCRLPCFNCGAIAVPREAWCSHWSGRWYVPTNQEKAPCVVSFLLFKTSDIYLFGLSRYAIG